MKDLRVFVYRMDCLLLIELCRGEIMVFSFIFEFLVGFSG